MRTILLNTILFLIFSSFIIAQDIDTSLISVTLKIRSVADFERISDLLPGKPVHIGENQYYSRIRPQDINLLRWLGIEIKVSATSMDKKSLYKMESPGSTTAPNPLVQEIIDNVSRETLATRIQELQNFGTRYEYTPTQDSAAVYLYNLFQRWGLNTEYDSFDLGTSTIYDVDYVSSDIGWVCGTNGLIAYTTDGGSVWTNHSSGFTNTFYGMDFISSTTGWVVSDNGIILKSTNGGVAWSSQSSSVSNTLYDVSFVNDQLGLIVGTSGRILRTTNGGGTWTNINSGTTNTLRKVIFIDSMHAWVVGGVAGSYGKILRSTDGGLNWASQSIPPSTGYLRGVFFIDTLNGWATGDGPTILKTTNGGTNWIGKTPPPGTGTILRGVSFLNLFEGWTVDYYGSLLHTTDGGESWFVSYTPPGSVYLVDLCAFSTDRITLTGTSTTIFTSTDGGTTWISQTSNLPAQFFHATQNVVGTITGSVTPEREYVIVAHYDSYSDNPYVSAPGADDNATGISAVMEAARLFSVYKFNSTIRFLAVSAEELGLHGSKHYASVAQTEGRNIVGVVNGDMIGYPPTSDSSRLVIGSYLSYNRLIDSAISYNTRYNLGLNLVALVDNSGASDHAPFATAGYDALDVAEATAEEIWGGSNPYYHKTTDTFDKLNMGMVWNGARLMLTTIAEMAQPFARIGDMEPLFSVIPTSIDFGTVQPGNSKIDSAIVTNDGTDTLMIQSVNSDRPEFNIFPTTYTLPPGESGKFYFTFTPTTVGSKTGNAIFTHNASSSPDSLNMSGIGAETPIEMTHIMKSGWNMISPPLTGEDMRKIILFPVSASDAFSYEGVYNRADTLIPQKGYWLKFASDQSVSMTGYAQTGGTIEVKQGWNMIGSFSIITPVLNITSNPTGIIDSEFFTYENGYIPSDTLKPWGGYWVKVKNDGILIIPSIP